MTEQLAIKKYETPIYCNGRMQCIVNKDHVEEVLAILRACYPKNVYAEGGGKINGRTISV